MDDVDHNELVGQAVTALVDGLKPFVSDVLAKVLPPGTDWPEVLRVKDVANGRRGGEYRSHDLSLMLRVMTERLGDLGYPFSRHMPRQAEIYARELREVRNRWAHNHHFTAAEAYRALDSADLLLRAIGADDIAVRLSDAKASVSPIGGGPTPFEPVKAPIDAHASNEAPTTPGPTPHAAKDTNLPRIDIQAVSDLSYAMAHCRIPVIDHITVDNTGDDVHGAVVEVDVVSAEGAPRR